MRGCPLRDQPTTAAAQAKSHPTATLAMNEDILAGGGERLTVMMTVSLRYPLLLSSTLCLLGAVTPWACGGDDTANGATSGPATTNSSGAGGMMVAIGAGGNMAAGGNGTGVGGFSPVGSGGSNAVMQYAELWYSVADRLVRFPLNPEDGSVLPLQQSTISNPPPLGQNLLTMMSDGSLIGARLSTADSQTYFYHVPDPPRDGATITVVELGTMSDDLMLEGFYTDCDGHLYAMDTGSDATNADGNRLIRFTGDVVASDFSYVVVSDLATADVADIDDMSPGIDSNEIHDNPGLAIDSGTVHQFDYETGSGTAVGTGGSWGIHALGGKLFTDSVSRLYLLSSDAELFEMDPTTYTVSSVLATGPADVEGTAGHSGLAGPLTDCDTGFTPPQ